MSSAKFVIAHLSDLHFGNTQAGSNGHTHCGERLSAIADVLRRRKADLTIVTGDVSDRGDRGSLDEARRWLEGIKTANHATLPELNEHIAVIPGNHDAYDSGNHHGTVWECIQRALGNYNAVFPEHSFNRKRPCRYRWIQRSGRGIFIALVNSCYLGDPDEKPGGFFDTLSRVACGKLSREQTERLLDWFDLGRAGNLG